MHELDSYTARCEAEASDAQLQEEHGYIADEFHNLKLLDEVFGEFLATNIHQGKHFSFEDFLLVKYNQLYVRFTHRSVPYLAAVFRCAGSDADWINIELANYDFSSYRMEGREVSRHGSDGWGQLDADRYLSHLPCIRDTVRTLYGEMAAFYNCRHQRLDLKLYPKQPAETPHLSITFMPGYPDEDHFTPRDRIP